MPILHASRVAEVEKETPSTAVPEMNKSTDVQPVLTVVPFVPDPKLESQLKEQQ